MTLPPWKLCYRIVGLRPIPSIGWSSGKKNPAKPRLVAAANGPPTGPSSRNHWRFFDGYCVGVVIFLLAPIPQRTPYHASAQRRQMEKKTVLITMGGT